MPQTESSDQGFQIEYSEDFDDTGARERFVIANRGGKYELDEDALNIKYWCNQVNIRITVNTARKSKHIQTFFYSAYGESKCLYYYLDLLEKAGVKLALVQTFYHPINPGIETQHLAAERYAVECRRQVFKKLELRETSDLMSAEGEIRESEEYQAFIKSEIYQELLRYEAGLKISEDSRYNEENAKKGRQIEFTLAEAKKQRNVPTKVIHLDDDKSIVDYLNNYQVGDNKIEAIHFDAKDPKKEWLIKCAKAVGLHQFALVTGQESAAKADININKLIIAYFYVISIGEDTAKWNLLAKINPENLGQVVPALRERFLEHVLTDLIETQNDSFYQTRESYGLRTIPVLVFNDSSVIDFTAKDSNKNLVQLFAREYYAKDVIDQQNNTDAVLMELSELYHRVLMPNGSLPASNNNLSYRAENLKLFHQNFKSTLNSMNIYDSESVSGFIIVYLRALNFNTTSVLYEEILKRYFKINGNLKDYTLRFKATDKYTLQVQASNRFNEVRLANNVKPTPFETPALFLNLEFCINYSWYALTPNKMKITLSKCEVHLNPFVNPLVLERFISTAGKGPEFKRPFSDAMKKFKNEINFSSQDGYEQAFYLEKFQTLLKPGVYTEIYTENKGRNVTFGHAPSDVQATVDDIEVFSEAMQNGIQNK